MMRKKYPILEKGIFLNHAATAPVSHATIARMKALCDEMREPLGEHFYRWLGILEETRRLIAELLNSHPSEIALTQNTSSSLSIIAGCIDFKPGDRVLVPRDEFPSNRYVWQNLKYRGVECHFFDIEDNLIETLQKQDLSKVRLISISLVGYLTGKKHDLKSFGEFCRKHNILSCVDAIQAVGTFPIDLQNANIDFLAGGAQKWLLGPLGCGYLYIRKELIEKVNVPLVGWTSTRYPENFDLMQLDFAPEATRFEPGLSNIAAIGGFNESLRELGNIGWNHIYQKIASNTRYLIEGLCQIDDLQLSIEDPKDLGAIVGFKIPQRINPKKLLSDLAEKRIVVTARGDSVRISPHFYNTSEELDRFMHTIGRQLDNRHLFFPEIKLEKKAEKQWILLNGATGVLGREIALYLAEKGFNITGIGRNTDVLKELQQKIGISFDPVVLDLTHKEVLAKFFEEHHKKYAGLINCSGIVEVELTAQLDPAKLAEMLQVNFLAPSQFMQQFVSKLCTEDSIGILNIVSPSGRCGYPLLGGYAASHAALWTLSESLDRELSKEKLHVTTFISPPIHSRMQKKIGRNLLRYFQMKGNFNYDHAEEVARRAVDAFLARKGLVISHKNRFRMILNSLSPRFITQKIAKFWLSEKAYP
jgi:cysteine desulfurase/selenocysteine lyase